MSPGSAIDKEHGASLVAVASHMDGPSRSTFRGSHVWEDNFSRRCLNGHSTDLRD